MRKIYLLLFALAFTTAQTNAIILLYPSTTTPGNPGELMTLEENIQMEPVLTLVGPLF